MGWELRHRRRYLYRNRRVNGRPVKEYVAADDQMVVDRDAQGPAGLDHLAGHVDVGLAVPGIARGVVVHQDDGRGRQL